MKIAIIGTGGVGGYFGGKMANAGYDVSFLARGKHLEAIRENGLQIKSIKGDFKITNVHATDTLQEIGIADLILLSVKAWQIKDFARELPYIIHENSLILPLQNGILVAEELSEFVPKENILGGLCRIISKIDAPGVINHFGVEPTIVFGELDNKKTARVERIKTLFDKSGFNSRVADDIQAELWKKFISICVSGLLAITKSTYGEIRELPQTRKMMIDLLTEIYILSQKVGINLEHDFIEKTVSYIDTFPYDSTSSLARDVWEGKPSEIEYQNGTVVKLSDKYGLESPINRFVYNCILPMERRARSNK
jgi:2-dehydropantoate 2-reductase